MPIKILISGNFLQADDWNWVEGGDLIEIKSFPKLDRLQPNELEEMKKFASRADLAIISLFGSNPDNLQKLDLENWKCQKALWTFDSHHGWRIEKKYENLFHRIFVAHSPYLKFFQKEKSEWLPCGFVRYGMNSWLNILRDYSPSRAYDVIFPHKSYPIGNRDAVALAAGRKLRQEGFRYGAGEFTSGEPYFDALRSAGVVLNISLLDDLNIRNFETWASGRILLTNPTPDHARLGLGSNDTFYFDRNLGDFSEQAKAAVARSIQPGVTAQAVFDGHMLIHRYVQIINQMLDTKLRVRTEKVPEIRIPGAPLAPRNSMAINTEERHSNIGVSILAYTQLPPAPALCSERLQIEDNIGESIHVHWRNLRLDFTVRDFLSLANACEISLGALENKTETPSEMRSVAHSKEITKSANPLQNLNLDPAFLKDMGSLVVQVDSVEIVEKKLSELLCIVKSGNPTAPTWAATAVSASPAFRFLSGQQEEYVRYVSQYSLPSHGPESLQSLEASLLKKGYPAENHYITLFGDELFIRDGQHRAAILQHHLGDVSVPVAKIIFRKDFEGWRMNQPSKEIKKPKNLPLAEKGPISRFNDIREKVEAIKGYMMEGQEEALFLLAKSLPDHAVIVEIGSFQGRSAVSMGYAIRGTKKRIYAIDTFQGNVGDFQVSKKGQYVEGFLGNVSRNDLWPWIFPLRGLSHEVGRRWGTPIDFIFIDGSHAYEDVKLDYELFAPFVKTGGLIAFHDVVESWPGPLRLWNEIKGDLSHTGNVHSLYWGRKKTLILA
jgi:hypothetical protein